MKRPIGLTRPELAARFRIHPQTMANLIRGYYVDLDGGKNYYYADHRFLSAVTGRGRRNSPFRYQVRDVLMYLRNMRISHFTIS